MSFIKDWRKRMISTDYSKSEEMAKELTDRNCEKCVHHMNGYC